MKSLIGDIIEAVFDFAKLKLEKTYSLLRTEGFSSGFTSLLIILISVGAITFGLLNLFILAVVFSERIGLKWRPLLDIFSGLMSIFYAGDMASLIIHSFVILHLPVIVLIVVQKIITRNLIKKYRDKESDLIKP